MKRLEKEKLIANLGNVFTEANAVMVVHYKGMTVANLNSLREKAYPLGINFKVVKNSLAVRALGDTKNQVLNDFFVGPTAIAWGEDPLSCAKLVNDFAKTNPKFVIVGGSYDGIKLASTEVTQLANLPSFDEIRGKLAGLLVAVATKVAVLAKTPATNLVGVTKAYGSKN
ncbi:50S ribosomal protein L10 [Candidatus Hepatincola sp. Av]